LYSLLKSWRRKINGYSTLISTVPRIDTDFWPDDNPKTDLVHQSLVFSSNRHHANATSELIGDLSVAAVFSKNAYTARCSAAHELVVMGKPRT
jgi:hypothetical protein